MWSYRTFQNIGAFNDTYRIHFRARMIRAAHLISDNAESLKDLHGRLPSSSRGCGYFIKTHMGVLNVASGCSENEQQPPKVAVLGHIFNFPYN